MWFRGKSWLLLRPEGLTEVCLCYDRFAFENEVSVFILNTRAMTADYLCLSQWLQVLVNVYLGFLKVWVYNFIYNGMEAEVLLLKVLYISPSFPSHNYKWLVVHRKILVLILQITYFSSTHFDEDCWLFENISIDPLLCKYHTSAQNLRMAIWRENMEKCEHSCTINNCQRTTKASCLFPVCLKELCS